VRPSRRVRSDCWSCAQDKEELTIPEAINFFSPRLEFGNTGEDAYATLGLELRLAEKYHRRPACVAGMPAEKPADGFTMSHAFKTPAATITRLATAN
jgi:hypothetical protein